MNPTNFLSFSKIPKFFIAFAMFLILCMEGNALTKYKRSKPPFIPYAQRLCNRRCVVCDCSLSKAYSNICDRKFLGSPFIGEIFRKRMIYKSQCRLFRKKRNRKWRDVRWACAMDCAMQCYCKHCFKDDECCRKMGKKEMDLKFSNLF